jgi:hypothetical protein
MADSSAELLQQLTRIADALSKPASPWTEWARVFASFAGGVLITYLGIFLQGFVGDRREQTKMRRIIYRELADAIIWMHDMMDILSEGDNPESSKPDSSFWIDDPSFAVHGDEYMSQHQNVAYELREMGFVKQIYSRLRTFGPGKIVHLAQVKGLLIRMSKAFRHDPFLRRNFKRFAGSDFDLLQRIAGSFAGQKLTRDELD